MTSAAPTQHAAFSREPELDGLRAIAATMVLLFHCLTAVAAVPEVEAALLKGWPAAIANGGSAVVLFFVLSGYVLAGSWLRDGSAAGSAAFLVRRALRLYPAYVAALLLAWCVSFVLPMLPHGAGESAWARARSELQLPLSTLLLSALAPGEAYGLVPVGWTLRLELWYSLAFPLLMLIARRTHVAMLVIASGTSLLLTPDRLMNYAFPFTVGIAMFLHRDRLAAARTLAPLPRLVLLVAAVAAFALPPTILWPVSRLAGMGLSTFGSAALILLAPLPPLAGVLRSRPLVRLGEVSYSLYLLHVPVALVVASLLLGDAAAGTVGEAVMRWLAVTALVLPVTVLLAAMSYAYIEAPGMRWRQRGRRSIEQRGNGRSDGRPASVGKGTEQAVR